MKLKQTDGQPIGCQALLSEARELFASTLLSRREKQVADLMLQSYRMDACVNKLGVSIETLRVHRRNIYRKLDINSHLELFSLFFACLDVFVPGQGVDPLLCLHHQVMKAAAVPVIPDNELSGLIYEQQA